MEKKTNKKLKQRGITLIALVITIIVLLILAGISIGALTGEGGIIGNAKNAKEETEIANEKEIIDKAVIMAMGENSRGNLVEEEFQNKLDGETGKGKTEVVDAGEEFGVTFIESNRYYTVDKDGNVMDSQEIVKDNNPGDITIGQDGEELEGSEEQPYEIWSIEDLVSFANQVNGGNRFNDKYIELARTLDFRLPPSYDNPKTKVSERQKGIIEPDDNGIEIKTLLTEQNGKGFNMIGNENNGFWGNFNGNGKEIRGIYINRLEENYIGFFGGDGSATIKNLTVSGNIKALGVLDVTKYVGGVATNTWEIINCCNKIDIEVDVTNACDVGGISQWASLIKGCINKGDIIAINQNSSSSAEISGISNARTIENCYNEGNLIAKKGTGNREYTLGGISSNLQSIENVKNCYNLGDLYIENPNTNDRGGGICGDIYTELAIENCYNLGKININTSQTGGILGVIGKDNYKIMNCYNSGKIANKGGGIAGWNYDHKGTMSSCFYQKGVANGGVGSFYKSSIKNQDLPGEAEVLEESQMPKVIDAIQNQIEVDGQMIDVWKEDTNNINNGYPILYWQ